MRILFILLLSGLFVTNCFSQSLGDLNKEKKQLMSNIGKANSLLETYGQKKSQSLVRLAVLNKQLNEKNRLLEIYEIESQLMQIKIDSLNLFIVQKGNELDQLKSDYAELIRKSYNNSKVFNEISFFLGASSFNEAYRRFILLKEYNKFRRNYGLLIEQEKKDLISKRQDLEIELDKQLVLQKTIVDEKRSIAGSHANLEKSVSYLKKKEYKIKKQLKTHQKALAKLERNILNVIKNSKREKVAFSNFSKAKGKLVWPVENGIIISKFGEHQHPVFKYVRVNNNGVDIKYVSKNTVYPVFEGKVSRVVTIPGYNKAVIVRHGKFLTVYANLKSVKIAVGDQISSSTVLGTIYEGDGENSGVLHFEIWEENAKLNPELWLRK